MVNFDKWHTKAKPISEEELIKRIGTNFTDTDIKRYLGGGIGDNLIKYSDLEKYKSITDLLPHDKDYKIILLEADDFNKGHFIAVMRYKDRDGKDTVEFFNSYGKSVDSQKNSISECRNRILGQTKNYLSSLFRKRPKGMKYVWNRTPFQKLKPGINTCGRWCIFRILMMRDMLMDLKKFKEVVELNHKGTGLPRDALVSLYIP